MTEGVEVHHDQVRSGGQELQAIADRFQAAVRRFQSEIEGFGQPWGGDDIGMLIGLSHSAVFQAALESFQSNAEELAGHAQGLGTAADVHAAAEKGSTLSVNRVGKLL